MKTPALRFCVDRKHSENGAFRNNDVTMIIFEFSSKMAGGRLLRMRRCGRKTFDAFSELGPCYTKQFFSQLATQQTLRCKLQEKIHV